MISYSIIYAMQKENFCHFTFHKSCARLLKNSFMPLAANWQQFYAATPRVSRSVIHWAVKLFFCFLFIFHFFFFNSAFKSQFLAM